VGSAPSHTRQAASIHETITAFFIARHPGVCVQVTRVRPRLTVGLPAGGAKRKPLGDRDPFGRQVQFTAQPCGHGYHGKRAKFQASSTKRRGSRDYRHRNSHDPQVRPTGDPIVRDPHRVQVPPRPGTEDAASVVADPPLLRERGRQNDQGDLGVTIRRIIRPS